MKKKSLFNFYLDDDLKQEAIEKLNRVSGEKQKGQLASLIRVSIKQFVDTPDNEISPLLLAAIDEEYEYGLKLNERSRL